jgi:Ohr subfamily peroxiredoxin
MSRAAAIVHTAKTNTTGGRENGRSRSSDGRLDVRLSTAGSARIGANPEQLFGAAWSASFASAIASAARERKIAPAESRIEAEVDLILGDGGYFLATRLRVELSGVPREVGIELIAEAETICPYSRATRGNMAVTVTLV